MRNNYITNGVGLTLVGTLCLSICTAAPQKKSSSLNKLVPQLRADSIGFDSGFWRSEYLQQPKQDKDETTAATSDVTIHPTTSGSAKTPPPAFVYSDKLITIPLDTPATMNTQILEENGEPGLQEEAAMSEWENAGVESGANLTPGFTASGPSVTSAIVGCVGIMIVIGAYVSSGKRNR